MGPAVVLGGLVVLSVVVLGVTLGTSPRGSRMGLPALRRALPWVLAGTVAVAFVDGIEMVDIRNHQNRGLPSRGVARLDQGPSVR